MTPSPIAPELLAQLYTTFREKYRDRDERMQTLDSVVAGEWAVVDPDNGELTSRSPNLIQVALEDTAEAASSMPTVRVTPRKNTNALKTIAGQMEKIAAGYLDHSVMDLLVPQTVMDMAAFGFAAWVVWPDDEEKLPVIERRDPRHCYPEPGLRPGQKVRRCIFSRSVDYDDLPPEYQVQLTDFLTDDQGRTISDRLKINLVELFTDQDVTVACMFEVGTQPTSMQLQSTPSHGDTTYVPVIVDYFAHHLGACPVVIGSRFTLDGEFRGQFDQVVGVLEGHVRLMAMILDYADQSVYSDVWVKDLIGELSWGGGAYIELGPQGAIGRVAPAVSSLNVQQDLDRLVDGIHVGGRWPKSRPGEIDQAIASAKFVEATAGMLNTAIKTYHQILQRMMEHAVRLSFQTDLKFFPGKKSVTAVLRNQEFVEEYDTKDIDLKNRIRIEYGVGLGRDPAQSAVLMIQYAKEGYISNEWVQENIEGLTDVARERVRIDTEKMESMLMATLLQGVQEKSIPPTALPEMIDARAKGETLANIYRKYVVEPQQEAPGGMPGMPPGLPPGAQSPPGGPPGAPGLPQGVVPPAPPADALMSRLGVPAGNRQSFMSVGA